MAKSYPRYEKCWMTATATRVLAPIGDTREITEQAVNDAVHLLIGRLLGVPIDMHVSICTAPWEDKTLIIACAVGYTERRMTAEHASEVLWDWDHPIALETKA